MSLTASANYDVKFANEMFDEGYEFPLISLFELEYRKDYLDLIT